MLTVRASKKRRFFPRRDVILIRRRRTQRPRAGTRAHILLAFVRRKYLPTKRTSPRACFIFASWSVCAYLLSADKWWPFYRLVCFSRFFEVGFSLAENPPHSVFEINFFLFSWWDRDEISLVVVTQPRKRKKQTSAELKNPKQNFFFQFAFLL